MEPLLCAAFVGNGTRPCLLFSERAELHALIVLRIALGAHPHLAAIIELRALSQIVPNIAVALTISVYF